MDGAGGGSVLWEPGWNGVSVEFDEQRRRVELADDRNIWGGELGTRSLAVSEK